jgi:hypothetical protein
MKIELKNRILKENMYEIISLDSSSNYMLIMSNEFWFCYRTDESTLTKIPYNNLFDLSNDFQQIRKLQQILKEN